MWPVSGWASGLLEFGDASGNGEPLVVVKVVVETRNLPARGSARGLDVHVQKPGIKIWCRIGVLAAEEFRLTEATAGVDGLCFAAALACNYSVEEINLLVDSGDPCLLERKPGRRRQFQDDFEMVSQEEVRRGVAVTIRQYVDADVEQLVALDKRCEIGVAGSGSLAFDLLGDPLCRVRHLPTFHMLVAEVKGEIVGVIRGSVKEVVCSQTAIICSEKASYRIPLYARVGYLLGLRVCPWHRRIGIALKLAGSMEEWCRSQKAEYVYMATEKGNKASLKLFTERLNYVHFRTPAIFVQPVHVHDRRISPRVQLTRVAPGVAAQLYRATMGTAEFFPKDIDAVLRNALCEGTWIATLRADARALQEPLAQLAGHQERLDLARGGSARKLVDAGWARGASWAMLSVWRSNELFQCEYKNASWLKRTAASVSRWLDFCLPGCHVPSVPNFFHPFGVQFMFGLHADGARGKPLLHSLCWHAHNLARRNHCKAIMSEVAKSDPAGEAIPHWKSLSATDDMWCIKSLRPRDNFCDWCLAPAKRVLFVDPREV